MRTGTRIVGLRWVAVLEASKGIAVLVAGFALLHRGGTGLQRIVDLLVGHLHLNPAKGRPRVFREMLDGVGDGWVRALALGAAVYACARLVEAYGLWMGRDWARWFGILSAAVYVPFELYELAGNPGTVPALALLVNGLVVAVLWRARASAA